MILQKSEIPTNEKLIQKLLTMTSQKNKEIRVLLIVLTETNTVTIRLH